MLEQGRESVCRLWWLKSVNFQYSKSYILIQLYNKSPSGFIHDAAHIYSSSVLSRFTIAWSSSRAFRI